MSQTIDELQAEGRTLEVARLFPRQGEWTEEDYFTLPETNRIVELSEGRLIITPAPTDQHQKISFRLSLFIGNYVMANALGEVRCAPLDVRLWPGAIRQPDIVFMSNEHKNKIAEKYWGVPDLVMEILSESTEKEDRIEKFSEYEEAGILEYWIIDPANRIMEVYVLAGRSYEIAGKWSVGEVVYSKVLPGFQAAVDDVFGK